MKQTAKCIIRGTPFYFAFCVFNFPAMVAFGADVNWEMDPMKPDFSDQASLQRGASLYVNFCLGCHSLNFQRYERTADDLGIPHDLMSEYLILTGQKIGDLMGSSVDPEQSQVWFGAPPPDLTMVTRVRDPEWVYNFLRTFYVDPKRPFGVNNKVFPNVGMPHVLLPLQGIADEICIGKQPIDILDAPAIFGMTPPENCPELGTRPGTGAYTPEEFDKTAYDIVNFLSYVGEPTRRERLALGGYVIGFLFVLWILAFFLNREYWKDIRFPSSERTERHST